MNYKIGRNNFALTIFMPIDCKNGCSFCTSKRDYQTNKPDMNEVLKAIHKTSIFNIPFSDIVITGGEPFADIGVLKVLLAYTRARYLDCNFYINTSLPKDTVDEAIDLINNTDYITGVNISRHLKKVFCDKVADIEDIKRIKKPIHFNCVLFDEPTDKELKEYCDFYSPFGQPTFRADYRLITQSDLHSFDFPLFKQLDNLFNFTYSTQCHVCHTDYFENGSALHRGVENSHIEFKNYVEVNDIIIKQDGEIRYDWNPECITNVDVLRSLRLEPVVDYTNVNEYYDISSSDYGCGGRVLRLDSYRSNRCGIYSSGCGSNYVDYNSYSGCGGRTYSGGCGGGGC